MRVLLLLPYLKRGGTEIQSSYICNYLQDHGHEVTLVSIEEIRDVEFMFHTEVCYLGSRNRLTEIPTQLVQLRKIIRQKSVDLIVSRSWTTNTLASLLSLVTRKPSVLFLSASADLSAHRWVVRFVHSLLYRHAKKVIAVSAESKGNAMQWLGILPERVEVIYNGIDKNLFVKRQSGSGDFLPEPANENRIVILFVGRMAHRKGPDLLIEAFHQIQTTHPADLLMVGNGEMLHSIKAKVAALNLTQKVTFFPETDQPYAFMKFADIFVLPSRSEGFPNILLEAMVSEMAVIAADCSTGPGEIINSENGILIPAENADAIAEALKKTIDDSELRKRMGRNAKETVLNRFNLEHQLSKIEKIFIEAVK